MRTTRAAFAVVVVLGNAATAMAQNNPEPTAFPGPVSSVKSPASAARVYYTDPGPDADGIHKYKLMFRDAKGHETLLDSFIRSVEIQWSPSGTQLFVNDYIGSNIADCLIVQATVEPLKPVSLQDLVVKSPGRPSAPETPDQSHYAALCKRWVTDTRLAGSVSGHVDGGRDAHAFDHPLVYDLGSDRVLWQQP
ncbi:MAG TPA: hypothetical protein VL899_15105 [Alphaproteobacteria bacterium]|jgi:hypothetical protein|nr:hypothetical protein [Alphaproteobacteria bacterium]